jgi:prevent-host-death family protein
MRGIGLRELKVHASRIFRRVRETQEAVPITYRGQVIAHVVPAEEYERLKAGRADFWDSLRAFRERARNAPRDLGDAFEGTRSRAKGRSFKW